MKSLVTVIIPVYNAEKDINRCLESIVNQDYKNIEVLLINDGSHDNSLNILKEYEKNYKYIKVIDQKNIGVARTRNNAVKIAKGKYIMFVDNDDYIDSNYISTYINEIEKEDYDIVIGGYIRITEDKKILKKEQLSNEPFSKFVIMAPWAKIYKRDFIIKNNIKFLDYKIGEDVYFNINAYFNTDNIKITNYTGYYWFYNTKSVSNTKQKSFSNSIDIIYLLDKITKLDKYKNNKINNYYFTRYYIWFLLFAGKNSSPDKFYNEYKKISTWLKKKQIRANSRLLSKISKGDNLKNKMIVLIFRVIEKLHLVKLFAKLYCKGGSSK